MLATVTGTFPSVSPINFIIGSTTLVFGYKKTKLPKLQAFGGSELKHRGRDDQTCNCAW